MRRQRPQPERFATIGDFPPGSAFVESYGLLLVTLVTGRNGHPVGVIAVTAAEEGAGTTTTVLNLGMTMARTGRSTLLIDANLRSPALHRAFGLEPGPGLSELLQGTRRSAEVIRITEVPNLWVLTAGSGTAPGQGLLELHQATPWVESLRKDFFVLFDTPPVLAYSDTLTLTRLVDGVVLVIPADNGPQRAVQEARRRLEQVNAKILGAILNGVARSGVPD